MSSKNVLSILSAVHKQRWSNCPGTVLAINYFHLQWVVGVLLLQVDVYLSPTMKTKAAWITMNHHHSILHPAETDSWQFPTFSSTVPRHISGAPPQVVVDSLHQPLRRKQVLSLGPTLQRTCHLDDWNQTMSKSHYVTLYKSLLGLKYIPCRELTYSLPTHFWRWFSFSQGGIF